jgi:ABC-2 type transport system permease protein
MASLVKDKANRSDFGLTSLKELESFFGYRPASQSSVHGNGLEAFLSSGPPSLKELRSFLNDYVLLGLVIYAFTLAIMAQAQSNSQELRNASIAIVDEDHSALSRQIVSGFLPPYFKEPVSIQESDIDPLVNLARFTFVLDIPPYFERDVRAHRNPTVQLLVDATAMIQAGIGSGYASQIMMEEVNRFMERSEPVSKPPVNLAIRVAFNPNVTTGWFTSVMRIINNVTMLAIILAGAAVVREREHGTMDHLLAMPLTPFEIAMAKVWANGLIIAVLLSLEFVVQRLLRVPINGSVPLFMLGVCLYLSCGSGLNQSCAGI